MKKRIFETVNDMSAIDKMTNAEVKDVKGGKKVHVEGGLNIKISNLQ